MRIPRPDSKSDLLVPDVALGSDQGGRYVLVVGKDDVVEQRKVETAQINVLAEKKRFEENLEKAQAAHKEIEKLTPLVEQQETRENRVEMPV